MIRNIAFIRRHRPFRVSSFFSIPFQPQPRKFLLSVRIWNLTAASLKIAVLWNVTPHKRNLANNPGARGGGGAKLTMGVGNFILQRSQIWKREKLVK
jgi:hypothetical protein